MTACEWFTLIWVGAASFGLGHLLWLIFHCKEGNENASGTDLARFLPHTLARSCAVLRGLIFRRLR